MAIPASQAKALFTQMLIDVYQERIAPPTFLRSFFPDKFTPTKYVSIEVERMGENVAVDVMRGTEGNRNTFSKSTEKIYYPPFYREFFDATNEDLYDRVLGSEGSTNTQLFTALLNRVADRLQALQDKIERRKELQCAQVLFGDGVVTMKNGDNIDFGRKAASIVNTPSQYFAANNDPFAVFQNGCKFIRENGRTNDAVFNAILGETALTNLLANTKFTARQNLFNMALDQVIGPVRNATGASYHGTITAGSYKVQLWAYPQSYKDPDTGTTTQYVDAKKLTIIPVNPRFVMAHCAVPQLIDQPGQTPQQGPYVIGNYKDPRKVADEFDIQSAFVAVPVAVDQIYTQQVVE